MRRSTVIALKLFVCAFAAWADPADAPVDHNKVGIGLFDQAKYAEAEQEHRKAIEIYRRLGAPGVSRYAASLSNLAAAVQAQGKTAEARQALEETLTLEPKLGEHRAQIIPNVLNALALMHHLENELPQALNLLQRALAMTPGAGETRAATLHNLAAVYFDMGRRRDAEEFFEQSVAMNKARGDKDSLPPAYTYLARLAGQRGDIARAESLMQQALEIRGELSPGHPVLAGTLGDVGELQKDTGKYDKAIESFQQALAILESQLGMDHMYAAPILFQYGDTLRLQGKDEEALALFMRTITILERAFGPDHARLATVYRSAAASSTKLKRKKEAKDYTKRAKAIMSRRVDYQRHTVDVSSFLPSK
jgi:tetratricopeptide (TPR) repeat protein